LKAKAEIMAAFEATVDDLLGWAAGNPEEVTLDECERRMGDLLSKTANLILPALVQLIGTGKETEAPPCPACGEAMRYVGKRPYWHKNRWAAVQLQRAYYYCDACGEGLAPLDKRIGLDASGLSCGLLRLNARLCSGEPFEEASGLLDEVCFVTLPPSKCEIEAKQIGAEIIRQQEEAVETAWTKSELPLGQEVPDTLYVTIDGTTVHIREEGWREMKAAAIYDVELAPSTKEEAEPEMQAPCNKSLGQQYPQTNYPTGQAHIISYLARLLDADHFGPLVWHLAAQQGVEEAKRVVVLGDGAAWIWNLAQTHFPQAVQIVDWYHASEHVWAAGRALYGEGTEQTAKWVQARLDQLWQGDVQGMLRAFQAALQFRPGAQAEIEQGITYFTNNAHRMRYAYFRGQGHHIGSGCVESACKRVIGARLKQAGMRWTPEGADQIAALRALRLSNDGRWSRFWHHRIPRPRTYTSPKRAA